MKIENYEKVQQLMEEYQNAVSNEGTYNRLIENLMTETPLLNFTNTTIVNINGIEVTLNRQQLEALCFLLKEAKGTESERLQSLILDL